MRSVAPKILVVGSNDDYQTAHQIRMLHNLGANIHVIPADLPPAATRVSWKRGNVTIDDHDLGKIDAALIRSLPPSILGPSSFEQPLDWPSYFQQYCLQRDRSDTLLGFLLALESTGVPCWNPPSRSSLVRRKPYQLDVIRRLGCCVPETLITNDPDEAVSFIKQYPDSIVKPAAGGALTINAGDLSRAELNRIRIAPAIFQQRVRGEDIRVIVVGNQVISAAAILVPSDTIDFRGNPDYSSGNIQYREVNLPENIKQDCIRICAALGYRYGGLDLKQVTLSHFVFLECNNSPIYLDVEMKLKHPITEILASEIISSARDYFRFDDRSSSSSSDFGQSSFKSRDSARSASSRPSV